MALQLAGLTLLASVADIRRLGQFGTLRPLKVRTGFKALCLETSMAGFSVRKLAGTAHIAVVLAILAYDTGFVTSGMLQFDVRTNLFGNGCRIFA